MAQRCVFCNDSVDFGTSCVCGVDIMMKTRPNCKGTNIAEIMYGYPSSEFLDELKKDENKGKYQLGGCCISSDDPAFSCNDCGHMFGYRKHYENEE